MPEGPGALLDANIVNVQFSDERTMNDAAPRYLVNEYTPDPAVTFDSAIAATYLRYAHMLAARGYVQSTLGGMVIRAPQANYADGVAYAKPAGVSLEEMSVDDLVI